MSVQRISMISETNGYDAADHYDEPSQGTTYELTRIYKIENTDGVDQYFKFTIELDSYGNAGGNYSSVADSIPRQFIQVIPEQRTVTVFK